MSIGIDKLASELQKVIEEKDKNKKTPYDTEAEVVRVDTEVVWVKIPGGVDETPVQKTINAKVGDTVQVRVSGGRAFLVGNGTNPPTDDTVANVAIDNARDANQNATAAGLAAEQAIESANTANEKAYEASVAAAQAQTDAGIAHTAAEEAKADAAAANTAATQAKADAAAASTAAGEAKTAANEAKADAQAANTAATEAKADAARANTAANDSLSQLSIVEDVVGTLNWITTHATYKASADTEVHAGKWYFTKSGDTYNVVTNPTGNPSAKGYYEVDTIDEAVSNYIASHIALTSDGLYLTKDGSGYKILLANDGLKVYDPEGHLVSTFGESIILDSSRPQTIGNNNVYIKYYDKNNDGTPDSLAIKADEFLLSSGKTIQEELEGVENWFYSVAPTTSNEPAKNWTTDKLKEQHLRDIYFDTTSGKSYRWAKDGTTYKWVEIEDVELAALAKDLHDNYPPRSEFTVAPDKIQSTVSAAQTAATNAANTATDNKLKSYSTTTQMNSAIEQKANSIALSVAQTEISKIEVGGRNLARGTAEMIKGGGAWSTATWRNSGGSNTYNYSVNDSPVASVSKGVLVTTKVAKTRYGVCQDGCPMLSKKITFSVWAKGTAGGTINLQAVWWSGIPSSANWSKNFTTTGAWQYISLTADLTNVTVPNGKCSICYMYWTGVNVDDTCIFIAPKLEYGTQATDWTPAPEDLEAYTDTQVSAAKAEIKVTTDNISSEVSKKVGNSEIISKINQSAETVKIQASKVEIDGAATFNAIKAKADAAYDAKGAASTVQKDIEGVAVQEEQYIYISKASGTASVSGTTTWITEAGDKQNTWSTKRPTYNSSYPVLFVAKQKKVVSGTVTCTTPVKDDTTTIIDGGHITTGTIDASKATIKNISASMFTSSEQEKILNSKIEIGGRNLALNSKELNIATSVTNRCAGVYPSGDPVTIEGIDFAVSKASSAWRGIGVYLNEINPKVGDTFYYSTELYTDGAMYISIYLMCYNSSGSRVYPATVKIDGTARTSKVLISNQTVSIAKRIGASFILGTEEIELISGGGHIIATIQASGISSGSSAYMYAPKLEFGNKATDWTPAPEDIQSNAKDYADTVAYTVKAELDATKIDVVGESTSLLDNINAISDQITLLASRINFGNITVADNLAQLNTAVSIDTATSTVYVGDQSSFHVRINGTELGFYQRAQRVAYINNNQLYITQSVVLQQMDLGTPVAASGLGQWSWKVHPNGQTPSRNNLNLKWIG